MKKTYLKNIFMIISIIIMLIIFYFSNQQAVDSQNTSDGFLTIIFKVFYPKFNSISKAAQIILLENFSTFIRKLAHFLIFSSLGFSLIGSSHFNYKIKYKYKDVFYILFGLFYAIFDEVHQYFVPGRAMKIIDILIDFSGIIFGAIIFYLIIIIKNKIKRNA